MASLITSQSVRPSSWIPLLTLVALFAVGCTTPALSPKIEPEDFYPADWPEFVGAGENCRGIEGTFENQGEVVDSMYPSGAFVFPWTDRKHVRHAAWLSDMFGKEPPEGAEPAAMPPMQSCERVRLTIEPYADTGALFTLKNTLRLNLIGTRQIPSAPLGQYGPCATVKIDWHQCTEGVLCNPLLGSGRMWTFGLATDGSLIVRRTEWYGASAPFPLEARRIVGRFRKVP